MVDRLARAREGKLSKKDSDVIRYSQVRPSASFSPNILRDLSLHHAHTVDLGLRGSEGGKEVEGKKYIEDRLRCLPRLFR